MTGFLQTGRRKWYIMVFFWTNFVWRVFWYPFCVPYINISIFCISYQRRGRRSVSIRANPLIPYVGHIKTHIISKNWLVNFGNIFFILVYVLFWGKIPVFLKTGTRYGFGSWKFGCAVKSYIYIMKITLIVLKENFGLFFWSGT